MKDNKFKIGDRVGAQNQYNEDTGDNVWTKIIRYDEYQDDTLFGEITDITSKGKAIVQWDNISEPETMDPKVLTLEAKAKADLDRLEKEFKAVEKEVKAKMKDAGALLKEANTLSQTVGLQLENMWDACEPLLDAMDKCGWRTSSFGC